MKLRQKIFFIIFGLIAVFLLLEISLRLAGRIYHSYRIKNNVAQIDERDTVKILCLGDSFTFGEGAPKGYSYPEQLQRMLNNNLSKEFIVYNAGIPGSNSSQLFKNLENNIQTYKPHIIIMLTGANDDTNFQQSNYFLFADKSIRSNFCRLDIFLSQLRTYKLFKIGLINLRNQIRPKMKFKANTCLDNYRVQNISANRKNITKVLKNEITRHLELVEVYQNQGESNFAIAEIKKAIELDPSDDMLYCRLGLIYRLSGDDLLAMQALKKAVEINPFNKDAHLELFNLYYEDNKMDLALEALKKARQLSPNNEWIRQLLTYGIPDFKDMGTFEKLLKYNLQNIITEVQAKRIMLILVNYPGERFNEFLQQIAEVNKVPFVDNADIFKKIASSQDYKKQDYFVPDGHCNADGYQIIAQNVLEVLKSEIKEQLY